MKTKVAPSMMLLLAILIMLQPFCMADIPTPKELDKPHTLTMRATPLDFILERDVIWKPLQIEVDPDVLSKLKKDTVKCSISIRNVEMKYLLSWVVHFADANATIRKDGSIYMTTRDRLSKSDPLFECYKETKGKWSEGLKKKLEGNALGLNVKSSPLSNYLHAFSMLNGLPVIVDPALLADDKYSAKVTTSSNSSQSWGEALASTLNQVGLVYKLQGGVIFITKELAQPEHGADAERRIE